MSRGVFLTFSQPLVLRKILFGSMLLTGPIAGLAQPFCAQFPTAFQAGEMLEYRVAYRWGIIRANAGWVNFTIDSLNRHGQPLYHFVATARTNLRYDLVYKVRDRFESLARRQDLRPVQYLRDTHDGGFHAYNNNFFSFDSLLCHAYRQNKDGSERHYKTLAIQPCTYDAVSMFYNARSAPFEAMNVGQRYDLSVYLDEKVYNLVARFEGTEAVRTKQGIFNCYKVVTEVIAGTVFTRDALMTVWFTADANRMPVLIEAPLKVGRMRAEISKYNGLRNPVDAKLEKLD